MIVTLDGRRLNTDFAPQQTLQTLLDEVRASLRAERLLVAVARDGQELTGDELNQSLNAPLGATRQVDVESGSRRDVAAEALRDIAARIEQVGSEQVEIAAELNAGRREQAMQRFSPFLETWQTAQRAIMQCSEVLGQDLTRIESNGASIQTHLNSLADNLRELRRAFQAGDMVLLSDVLEYELPPLCQRWTVLLNGLAETLQTDAAARAQGEVTGSSGYP